MKELRESLLSSLFLILLFISALYLASNKDPKNYCKEDLDCLVQLAKETKDSSFCATYNDSDLCYTRMAHTLGNPHLCYQTKDEMQCLLDLAVTEKDMSICDKSSNVSLCYYSLAIYNNDTSICDKSKSLKELCVKRLIKGKNYN